jgi:hypothetical protein
METIQYSLKNTNAYSININNIISKKLNVTSDNYTIQDKKNINKEIKTLKEKINEQKINEEKINDNNNIFDKHCLNLYGLKTCILFYEDNYNIEVRLLDKINTYDNTFQKIKEDSLYKDIPFFLENKYTVIIVKNINSLYNKDNPFDTKEITDIHLPPN